MVSPDAEIGNAAHRHAGLLGELSLGAVFIKTRHRKEPVVGHVRRVVHGDQAVSVAGVADHQHARIAGGVVVDGLALAGKNLAVDAQQIAALHAVLTRYTADEQRPVGAIEAGIQIGGGDHIGEQRERAVIEFHAHAFQRGHAGFDLNQV